ncbi:unnamed protein product [Prunus armeniaca]|uniref:Uncharacterized protein n=1 Tax=Prunus armeniaca TaxID=36596 RepID=A0A6J5U5G4_PRUAR|nr:unnamed protein product [Prunus armeniaca]CAB4300137.1 unnamed protein product [Prunus armeniaca]
MDEERVGWVDSPTFYDHHIRTIKTQFDVLEMGRTYSGWFVKYHVDLVHDPPIPIPDLLQWEKRTVLLFLVPDLNENGGGGEECSSLLLHTPGKVISYNLKNKTFQSFELTSNPDSMTVWGGECRYMETCV